MTPPVATLLSPEYPPAVGGLGDYTARLASALGEEGGEVKVLTRGEVPHWDFRLLRQLERTAPPGIVHLQYQTGAYGMHPAVNLLPWWLARRRPDVRVVTTMHDLREPYLFPKAGPLRRLTTRLLVRHSRAVVATNGADAHVLEALAPGRVTLIPIGPNISPVKAEEGHAWTVRGQMQVPLGAALIGYFGFLNPTKGVDTLLRSMRDLLDDGVSVVLALLGASAGGSDPANRGYHDRMLRLATSLKLDPHVRWTGALDAGELSLALQALDCCVLPYADGASYRHGTLVTALAHGIPIVTTEPAPSPPFPGAPPDVVDGDHCVLVPPNDPAWLAMAIGRVLSERPLREQISAGAASLATHFSWDDIAARTREVYQQAS